MDHNEIQFCEDQGRCICGNDCMTGNPYLDGMDYIRLERVLGVHMPRIYSPHYLAMAAADYGDRAYILACDFWRAGDRVKAAWCARVFKSHKTLYDAMAEPLGNLCPYCMYETTTDDAMAHHINGYHAELEPQGVTADNWWSEETWNAS